MKNYKLLAPIILIVFFAAAIYMTYNANNKIEEKYNNYITAAQSFAKQGIIVDAIANYRLALEVRNTYELQIEIANFYINSKQIDDASAWCQDIISKYPKKVQAYSLLMKIYEQNEDYIACFELSDKMRQKKLPLDSVTETLNKINNYYYFTGQYEEVTSFSGGFCAVRVKGMWGFINDEGKKVIATKFHTVGSFRQELASVVDEDSKAYFIDTEGNKKKVVVGVENVKQLGTIEDGTYTLFNGTSWGLYNNQDKQIIGGFEDASVFANGFVAVKKDGMWSLINKEGKKTTNSDFDYIVPDDKGIVYRCDRLFARENGVYYLVDNSGKKITEKQYEDVKLFNDADFPYAAVKVGGKWGFIDVKGEYFVEPQYADARSFSGGYGAVLVDGKWGFIDTNKQMVIKNIFSSVKDFNDKGCVFVSNGDGWELLKLYKLNH